MAKTDLTKQIEQFLMRNNHKMNCFNCLEVGIVFKVKKPSKYNPNYLVDRYDTEICDFMQYDQSKDVFRCYEIKISKQDFYSKCKKTFVGNYNYYAMPKELYEEVKHDIPDYVGVVDKLGFCIKKPKKVDLKVEKEKLLVSMLKSLNRENYKYFYKELRKESERY